MSEQVLVAKELGKLFSCLSHPDRIRIIEELATGEKDVMTLAASLEISHSSTSQHLAKLRSLRLVEGRTENKFHFYSLVEPVLAEWVLKGLDFSELSLVGSVEFGKAIKTATRKWNKD